MTNAPTTEIYYIGGHRINGGPLIPKNPGVGQRKSMADAVADAQTAVEWATAQLRVAGMPADAVSITPAFKQVTYVITESDVEDVVVELLEDTKGYED